MAITLADWHGERPDRGEGAAMVRLFERRPDWLALGDPSGGILCRFDPAEGPSLILRWSEITIAWGDFVVPILYEDFDEPAERAADYAVEWIDGLLCGSLVLFTTRNSYGGSEQGLVDPAELKSLQARAGRFGYRWSVQRWVPKA